MKTQLVPLDQIVWNRFRDFSLYPLDEGHLEDLEKSLDTHDFFGGVKARRLDDGKIEIGCGHRRIMAARHSGKFTAVEIYVDEITDDDMVRLMAVENATHSGVNPGAVLNEVAAVTRRLVQILLGGFVQTWTKLFDGQHGFDVARGKLMKRIYDPNSEGGLGWLVVMRYLGDGDEKKSPRSKPQIVEALSTLKQSGKYDEIVDAEVVKHKPPVRDKPSAKTKAVATTKEPTSIRRRVLDERTAALFPNDYQFQAFRRAVTTEAGKKAIPVEQQYDLAKSILAAHDHPELGTKRMGAPFVAKMVEDRVHQFMNEQRKVDKEERDRYYLEQVEGRIDAELANANRWLRTLLSVLLTLDELARQYPAHPKIGGFSAKLDNLRNMIDQLAGRFDPLRVRKKT
jgi:hypothetical protein